MRHLIHLLDRLALILGSVSGFAVLLTMGIIVIDVLGRSVLNMPLPGATEMSILLLVCLVFLGLAAAQQKRQHYIVDLAVNLLGPRARHVLEALTTLLSLAVVGLFVWYTWKQAWSSILQGEVGFGNVAFPEWPSHVLIAFGFTLLALQLLTQFLRALSHVPYSAPQSAKPDQVQVHDVPTETKLSA